MTIFLLVIKIVVAALAGAYTAYKGWKTFHNNITTNQSFDTQRWFIMLFVYIVLLIVLFA